jgi:hypothetical protein
VLGEFLGLPKRQTEPLRQSTDGRRARLVKRRVHGRKIVCDGLHSRPALQVGQVQAILRVELEQKLVDLVAQPCRLGKIRQIEARLRKAAVPAREAFRVAALAFLEGPLPHWPTLFAARPKILNDLAAEEPATVRGAILRGSKLRELETKLVPIAQKASKTFLARLTPAPLDLYRDWAYAVRTGCFEKGAVDPRLDELVDLALRDFRHLLIDWGFNAEKVCPPWLSPLNPSNWLFALQGTDPHGYERGMLLGSGVPKAEVVQRYGVAPSPDPLVAFHADLRNAAMGLASIDVWETSQAVRRRLILIDEPAALAAVYGAKDRQLPPELRVPLDVTARNGTPWSGFRR